MVVKGVHGEEGPGRANVLYPLCLVVPHGRMSEGDGGPVAGPGVIDAAKGTDTSFLTHSVVVSLKEESLRLQPQH